MKETRLKIGKTYENTNGEEVKIIYQHQANYYGIKLNSGQCLRYTSEGYHIDKWDHSLKLNHKYIIVEVYKEQGEYNSLVWFNEEDFKKNQSADCPTIFKHRIEL